MPDFMIVEKEIGFDKGKIYKASTNLLYVYLTDYESIYLGKKFNEYFEVLEEY